LTLDDVKWTFNFYDKDNSGEITYEEYLNASSPHLLEKEKTPFRVNEDVDQPE